ncbi:MAG: arsenite methyltransferase [Candidatus Dormibacteraeota bacterium]|nr:arsenite methyltransferase [Candidatus Dormibacteraeota bacterium]
MTTTRDAVHEHYRSAALRMVGQDSACCAGDCCGGASVDQEIDSCGTSYTADELAQVGLDTSISLGCGNPLMLAELHPGEQVLDLGSGGGLDVLLSARRVAPGGHAYGVDMTDEMLDLANQNREKAGVVNATFLKGTIEQVPLPDATVDVVISNCVINLADDKGEVIREAFRVLKPGGRLAVSDMVELRPLPEAVKADFEARAGCVAGTIPVEDYLELLRAAGFESPGIEITGEQDVPGQPGAIGSASIRATKPV